MSGGRLKRRFAEIGDHVVLGSAISDPVHWHIGTVLWTDYSEVLVHQGGIAGQNPHKALHSVDYIRAFGSLDFCGEEKRHAEKIVRDAARQCAEVEDLARDLRLKLMDLFETVAANARKASDNRQVELAKAPP